MVYGQADCKGGGGAQSPSTLCLSKCEKWWPTKNTLKRLNGVFFTVKRPFLMVCGFSYFGCLWIFCNDGLIKKKRTDIESGSGFLRDWWLHLRERQRIFLSLSNSHYLYHFLYLQRSLAFSLSHRVSSGIGGCATEKVKISSSLFSLSFRLSHFLLFFSFFLSNSL